MPSLLPKYILLASLWQVPLMAQQSTYTIARAPFCSDKYDEYAPVFYKGGLVFTSNSGSGSLVGYSSAGGAGTFDICFVDTATKDTWKKAALFSKNLKTPVNDGPVTFTGNGDTIYYSRNIEVSGKLSEISHARNKLGIFSAVKENGKWVKIREMRFNNEWYNVTTPCLSPDGKRLYFASNKAGGFGGSDLYYSEWKVNYWGDPVNLGPAINTSGNESYPFVSLSGDLYFASDGHPGLGGKDIFVSRFADTAWLYPVNIESPVNSDADDFAFIIDDEQSRGFFSTSRGNSIDIYSFRTLIPQILYSQPQRENQSCFRFRDKGLINIDKYLFVQEWDFGDGVRVSGDNAIHCFPGPGNYLVRFNIKDRSTGREFFNMLSWDFKLNTIEQPYINAPTSAVVGEEIQLDGSRSYLPDYEILQFIWQIGSKRTIGESITHTFVERGIQEIKLGVMVRHKATGIVRQVSVMKNIMVFNTRAEADSFKSRMKEESSSIQIKDYDHATVHVIYSAEDEFANNAEFVVEIANSKSRIPLNDPSFRKVPGRFQVKELFFPREKLFSYVVDRQMDLVSTFFIYNEMIAAGFKNTRVTTFALSDEAEKELFGIKRVFGLSTDIYFDSYNRLTSSAYLILDQLARLLNKYPGVRLGLTVHTDNSGSSQVSVQISQIRVKAMFNYLVNKGIDPRRLVSIGAGAERPIASNSNEAGRKMNRRLEVYIEK